MITDIQNFIKNNKDRVIWSLVVVLIGILGFNTGRIFALEKAPKPIILQKADFSQVFNNSSSNKSQDFSELDFRVVVSKNSNKYHFSWCSGASRIKPENQIWFDSEEEAKKAGYTLAGNCTK